MEWRRTGCRSRHKAVARVEEIVTHVFEGGAVKAVSAGLRNHIHDAAGSAAELSLGIMPDYFKLLHRVDVRNHNVRRASNVGVDYTVKEIQL